MSIKRRQAKQASPKTAMPGKRNTERSIVTCLPAWWQQPREVMGKDKSPRARDERKHEKGEPDTETREATNLEEKMVRPKAVPQRWISSDKASGGGGGGGSSSSVTEGGVSTRTRGRSRSLSAERAPTESGAGRARLSVRTPRAPRSARNRSRSRSGSRQDGSQSRSRSRSRTRSRSRSRSRSHSGSPRPATGSRRGRSRSRAPSPIAAPVSAPAPAVATVVTVVAPLEPRESGRPSRQERARSREAVREHEEAARLAREREREAARQREQEAAEAAAREAASAAMAAHAAAAARAAAEKDKEESKEEKAMPAPAPAPVSVETREEREARRARRRARRARKAAAAAASGEPKKRSYRPGVLVTRDIRAADKADGLDKPEIPALAFQRLVREVAQDAFPKADLRFQSTAIKALHEAAESYLVELFEVLTSVSLSLHAWLAHSTTANAGCESGGDARAPRDHHATRYSTGTAHPGRLGQVGIFRGVSRLDQAPSFVGGSLSSASPSHCLVSLLFVSFQQKKQFLWPQPMTVFYVE
jgi:histone H3/H4